MTSNRLWVVPFNDGEAAEIVRLLIAANEKVIVTAQPWGASWQALEPEISTALEETENRNIIGIELQGPNRWQARNIDHHRYPNEDRWRPESAIEQVAALLNLTLNRWQTLVAANDRGYIPAMEQLQANTEEIRAVRLHDRRLQGVTSQDEQQARQDIAGARWSGPRAHVRCSGRATSAHSDFLYGSATEWLLIAEPNWSYSGPRHKQFVGLAEQTNQTWWSGGAEESGYFGIANPSSETKQQLEELFFNG